MAKCARKNCRRDALPNKKYCSVECRNFDVSERMIAKAALIKKQHGNSYYVNGFKKNGSKKGN